MKYRGFFITKTLDNKLKREDKDGSIKTCQGYFYKVFTDESKNCELDHFSAAVGFELADSSKESADCFAREMVDCEYKEYCRMSETMIMGGN